MKVGRNDLCPCGSGKKYKNCCLKNEYIGQRFYNDMNLLYAKVKSYNNKLLDKSNTIDYKEANFEDAIHFSITDNALSLIKNYLENAFDSQTALLNARNILENYVLLQMFKAGDIVEKHIEMFREQFFIIEYNSYKNIPLEMRNGFIDMEKLKKDYFNAKSLFLKYIKETDFKKIEKSRIPFLCNSKLSYNSLIKKYCKDYLKVYDFLSKCIHPSTFELDGIDKRKIVEQILLIVYQLYFIIPSSEKEKNYFDEKNKVYSYMLPLPDNYAYQLLEISQKQAAIFEELSKLFINSYGGDGYPSAYFRNLSKVIIDINTDVLLGYPENAKMKFKVILEMFAVYHKIYFDVDYEKVKYLYEMLDYHLIYNFNREKTAEKENEIMALFKKYKSIYKESKVTEDKFKKNYTKALGWLIDDKGNVPTYSRLVNEMLEALYCDEKIQNSDFTWKQLYSISYVESQNMSHGQGYLFFVNSGAWNDGRNIIAFIDQASIYILGKMKLWFDLYGVFDNRNKPIANKLEKCLNEIKEKVSKKNEILSSIPLIQKDY